MVCIYCGSDTKVTNSRKQSRVGGVWRRRECLACGEVFTTKEIPDTAAAVIVQKTEGQIEPFWRDKLMVSIYDSLKHRPTALADSTALTDTIWTKLMHKISNGKLSAELIAKTTYVALKQFDPAGGSHYLAFHPNAKA